MTEKHFCRCCLSEECYKDMANTYSIGNKTENYIEMLLNIFGINIVNDDVQRCLICEECVAKVRDAAAFKKKVLEVQETIKHNFSWDKNDSEMGTKTEDSDEAGYFDDFVDNISDKDFIWDNFTGDDSQKGQVFIITLEPKDGTQNKHKTIPKFELDGSTNKNSCTLGAKETAKLNNASTLGARDKDELKNFSIHDDIFNRFDDSDDTNTEGLDSEENCRIDEKLKNITRRSHLKRIVKKTKSGTAKQNKDEESKNNAKRREISQIQLGLKYKSENTLKLVQNSNLCLFRSLRNKFGCNFCQMNFPEFNELREHSITHKNPKFTDLKRLRGLSCKNADISDLKCSLCSENCTDLQKLTEHLKKEHAIPFHGTEHYLVPYKLQDGYQCILCELKFNTYMRLSVHMNTHYTNNVCEMCGLSFVNRLGLRTHVQAQHKEKKCPRCPAIFLTNSSKSKHLRQAHGIRNTKRYCNLCNKTFKYSYVLDEHKIQEHGVQRPAASRCLECGKTFLLPLNLKTHVRSVHIKERNYPCAKCGIRFFTSCDQRRHERTHEDVRSFCCSYCDAKFKAKDSWRRHLKRQHGHVFGETV